MGRPLHFSGVFTGSLVVRCNQNTEQNMAQRVCRYIDGFSCRKGPAFETTLKPRKRLVHDKHHWFFDQRRLHKKE